MKKYPMSFLIESSLVSIAKDENVPDDPPLEPRIVHPKAVFTPIGCVLVPMRISRPNMETPWETPMINFTPSSAERKFRSDK